MNIENTNRIGDRDREIVRRLASNLAEKAETRENQEKRDAWFNLDTGEGDRPMVLAELQGLPDIELPDAITTQECGNETARRIERELRVRLYQHDTLKDDHVIEPVWTVNWQVTTSDYGVSVRYNVPEGDGHVTARSWEAPIKDLDRDLEKLRPRTYSVNREATWDALERLTELFDGILETRIRGSLYWTLGMTWTAVELVGLEAFMLSMYDNPEGVHRLMRFLADDHLAFTGWLESEGLYTLNNRNDYIGSGSMGYPRDLPRSKLRDGTRDDPSATTTPRRADRWCLLESQEIVGVSPRMFEEFVLPYHTEISRHFGKVYYGCCEPLHSRIEALRRMENLARVSVSPWADEELMADACGRKLVYSRKPNPSLIGAPCWEPEGCRKDIRRTLKVADRCRKEIIMKDVHTLSHEPDRLAKWVALVRDEIGKHGG